MIPLIGNIFDRASHAYLLRGIFQHIEVVFGRINKEIRRDFNIIRRQVAHYLPLIAAVLQEYANRCHFKP